MEGRKHLSLSLDLPHDGHGKADAEAQQDEKTMCAWMYVNVDDASQASIRWAMHPSEKSLRSDVQCPHHVGNKDEPKHSHLLSC
jgi:hypothetical protein